MIVMKRLQLALVGLIVVSTTHAQWTTNGSGDAIITSVSKVGIGTSTPRGQLDLAGTGDIYLANSTVTGTSQSAFFPGHIYVAPYNGTDWSYFQARRSDNSGSTNFSFRTYNSGSLTEAMAITSNGNVGIGTATPVARLDLWENNQNQAGLKSTANLNGSSSYTLVAYTAGYTAVPEYSNKAVLQTY